MQKQLIAEPSFQDRARMIVADVRHSRLNRNISRRTRQHAKNSLRTLRLHPRFNTDGQNGEPKFEARLLSVRSQTDQAGVVPLSGVAGSDVSKQVQAEFRASSYPLSGIRCTFDGHTLTLSGTTTRYHFVQIAIGAARRLCQHGSIDCQIQVVPSPEE